MFWGRNQLKIKGIQQGIFCLVGVPMHALAMKLSLSGKCYFLDPNYGLFEYAGWQKMIASVEEHADKHWELYGGRDVVWVDLA